MIPWMLPFILAICLRTKPFEFFAHSGKEKKSQLAKSMLNAKSVQKTAAPEGKKKSQLAKPMLNAKCVQKTAAPEGKKKSQLAKSMLNANFAGPLLDNPSCVILIREGHCWTEPDACRTLAGQPALRDLD